MVPSKLLRVPPVVHVFGRFDRGNQMTLSEIRRQTVFGSFSTKSPVSLVVKKAQSRMMKFNVIYLAEDFFQTENVFLKTANITSVGELSGMHSSLLPFIFFLESYRPRKLSSCCPPEKNDGKN